jgi:hypothetical protein
MSKHALVPILVANLNLAELMVAIATVVSTVIISANALSFAFAIDGMLLHHLNKDRNHLDHSHQCQLVT